MKTLWAWLLNFISHAPLGGGAVLRLQVSFILYCVLFCCLGPLMGKLCSFNCLRWSLIFLNIFYITLGLILIGLVIATRTLTYMSEPHVLIVTAVAGSILVLLAIFGMIGAVRHNQVILFFYMIVLGLSLLFMFAVSVAALVTPKKIQETALATSWAALSDSQKSAIQISLNCCGFNNVTQNNSNSDSPGDMHPSCHVEPLTSPEVIGEREGGR
ncbi:PREDICTED: tetraspanin-31-like, partial [Amphimedon queenslandica]|uniref:Tetraspanin n=2 Tax=Amphimedon queenslandica TaxID=400682 RepID=A0AAN0IQF8_AMPQE